MLPTTALFVVGLALPASAASPAYNPFTNPSGQCLAVAAASHVPGARVIQWPCGEGKEQEWSVGNNLKVNQASGMCLAIPAGSRKAGAKAIQWPCNGGKEQAWTAIDVNSGATFVFRNQNSGMCLADPDASRKANVQMIQWPCEAGHREQQWTDQAVA